MTSRSSSHRSRTGRVATTRPAVAAWMIALALAALLSACGGDDDGASGADGASSADGATTVPGTVVDETGEALEPEGAATAAPATTAPATTVPVVDINVVATDFQNLNDMTPVRGFFVDNLLGDLEATLAVAENPEGGVYPIGSLVQLVPGEAMVKRAPGFDSYANDWEFFELDVDGRGTRIRVRGGAEVVNRFGGSCSECHALAEPEFDFICEDTHGCEPLPFERAFFEALQLGDPRPRAA